MIYVPEQVECNISMFADYTNIYTAVKINLRIAKLDAWLLYRNWIRTRREANGLLIYFNCIIAACLSNITIIMKFKYRGMGGYTVAISENYDEGKVWRFDESWPNRQTKTIQY